MPEFWTIDYSRKITLPPDFPVRVCKNGRLDRRFKKDLALAIAMIDKISRFAPDEVQYLGHFPFPRGWDSDMDCTINVGLGSGSRDRDMAMLQGIAQKQARSRKRLPDA